LEATKRQSYTIVQGPGVFSTFEALFTLFEEKLAPNGAPRNTWQTIGKGKTD